METRLDHVPPPIRYRSCDLNIPIRTILKITKRTRRRQTLPELSCCTRTSSHIHPPICGNHHCQHTWCQSSRSSAVAAVRAANSEAPQHFRISARIPPRCAIMRLQLAQKNRNPAIALPRRQYPPHRAESPSPCGAAPNSNKTRT